MTEFGDSGFRPGPELTARLRAARLDELAERMRDCLDQMDDLGIWEGGAHLSLAIDRIEQERKKL